MTLLDARELVSKKVDELKSRVNKLSKKPSLVIIRVGDDFASGKYVANKIKKCDEVGIDSKIIHFDGDVKQEVVEETILNLSSFGCIFTFPFWILGTYFIYTTMCKVNKKLALINTFCISYSLLMLGFYHYSYAIIYSIGTSKMIMQTNID